MHLDGVGLGVLTRRGSSYGTTGIAWQLLPEGKAGARLRPDLRRLRAGTFDLAQLVVPEASIRAEAGTEPGTLPVTL
jgi:hypothetical protein